MNMNFGETMRGYILNLDAEDPNGDGSFIHNGKPVFIWHNKSNQKRPQQTQQFVFKSAPSKKSSKFEVDEKDIIDAQFEIIDDKKLLRLKE